MGLDTGGRALNGSTLVLSLEVVANILLGTITHWRDPALVELNPDASLPNQPIVVIVPSTESEVTTQVCTGTGTGTGTVDGSCLT